MGIEGVRCSGNRGDRDGKWSRKGGWLLARPVGWLWRGCNLGNSAFPFLVADITPRVPPFSPLFSRSLYPPFLSSSISSFRFLLSLPFNLSSPASFPCLCTLTFKSTQRLREIHDSMISRCSKVRSVCAKFMTQWYLVVQFLTNDKLKSLIVQISWTNEYLYS